MCSERKEPDLVRVTDTTGGCWCLGLFDTGLGFWLAILVCPPLVCFGMFSVVRPWVAACMIPSPMFDELLDCTKDLLLELSLGKFRLLLVELMLLLDRLLN